MCVDRHRTLARFSECERTATLLGLTWVEAEECTFEPKDIYLFHQPIALRRARLLLGHPLLVIVGGQVHTWCVRTIALARRPVHALDDTTRAMRAMLFRWGQPRMSSELTPAMRKFDVACNEEIFETT